VTSSHSGCALGQEGHRWIRSRRRDQDFPLDRYIPIYPPHHAHRTRRRSSASSEARGAAASTPLKWNQVTDDLDPSAFHLGNAAERFERVGDVWDEAMGKKNSLRALV